MAGSQLVILGLVYIIAATVWWAKMSKWPNMDWAVHVIGSMFLALMTTVFFYMAINFINEGCSGIGMDNDYFQY